MSSRLATRAAAATTIVGLTAGVPVLLALGFGWPLPRHLPSWDQVAVTLTSPPGPQLVADVIAILGWITWAVFIVSLTADVAWLARHGLHRPPGRRPLRSLTYTLLAALVTGGLAGTTATAAAMIPPPPAVADHAPMSTHTTPAGAAPASQQPLPDPALTAPARRTALWVDAPPVLPDPSAAQMLQVQVADQRYTLHVQAGDTLWHLAEAWLGDPLRWPEIAQLNPERYPPNGPVSDGPVLVLPVEATTSQVSTTTPPEASEETGDEPLVHEVAPGDWMWHIAGRYLGDEERYPDIAELNPDLADRYANFPDHIQPGDQLLLPPDAADDGPRRHATGQAQPLDDPPAPPSPAPPEREPHDDPERSSPPDPPEGTTGTPSPGSSPSAPPPTSVPSGAPEPDGVVPMPTHPTTDPGSEPAPSAASPPPAVADPPDQPHDDHPGDPPGVDLPGGWVGIGLAAAIAAAAAWVWQRRRHRHRPPASGLPDPDHDPDLQPLPPVVARLRGAVRQQAPELLEPPVEQPTVAQAAAAGQPPPPPPAGPSGTQLAGLGTPPPGGMGLTGPGASAAARALLVASLSAGGPADPDARGEVVIPAGTLTDLLGGQALTELVGAIPRLHVTAGIGSALTWLDEQILTRIRTLGDYDLADLPTLRSDPWHEPISPLLLIAEVPESGWRTRLSASMQVGQAAEVHAVLLGAWPPGTTVEVAAEGTTDSPNHPHLSTLDIDTTLQLLTVLAEAHTGQTPRQAPVATTISDAEPRIEPTSSPKVDPGRPDQAPTPTQPSPTDQPQPAQPATAQLRVQVRVLGRAVVEDADGNPVSGLRATAVQLLTYLAAHRGGANIPDIQEAIWPEATLTRAGQRLSTTVANLRWALRTAAGISTDQASDWKPVVNTGGRYHLNPNCVQVDWWQVHDAAAKAAAARDPDTRRAALTEAVDAWGGLLHDNKYEWIDGHLHTCRQFGLAIHTQLAELVTDTDPQRARDLLQSAADIDPLNEQVARLAMRAHARLGEATAIRQRLATLTAALDEIDQEVDDTTRELANQLIDQAATQRQPPPAASP